MASITVCAMGLNIFPSIPTKARIGMYTIRIMISPKAAELLIFLEAVNTSPSISFSVKVFPAFRRVNRWRIASTMITAPSTINPKSMAPRLIRLAEIPNWFIIATANNIAKGITEATINPALQFPRNKIRIKITINPPSIRLVVTVPIAVEISLSLSRNGRMITPSGNDFSI